MVARKTYLSHLLAFKDKKEVKVVTGVRRCGKTMLFASFKQRLIETGIPEERVIMLNFESARHQALKNSAALEKYLLSLLDGVGEQSYLLLDEIQWVNGWEEVIERLRESHMVDIYVSASGIGIPTAQRAAFLKGAYVHIKMHPLSFKEYLLFNPINENEDADRDTLIERKFLNEYLHHGAMPDAATATTDTQIIYTMLLDIFDAAMARDVIERNAVRDAALLRATVEFLAANIGNTFSSKKISDYLSAGTKKTTSETIDNYLTMLEEAFLFHAVKRYDIKSKQYLKTLGKFYMTDLGMRNALLGTTQPEENITSVLKNVIYFELIRRNDRVYLGKYGANEIDFLADSYTDRKYYQVITHIPDAFALKQAIKPLEAINDNFEKNILTMEKRLPPSINGIRVIQIIDFLLHHR